jgi:hypothetical protein
LVARVKQVRSGNDDDKTIKSKTEITDMKTKLKTAAGIWTKLSALALLAIAMTSPNFAADNASYDPSAKQFAGTAAAAITGNYNLTIKAPGSLNATGISDLSGHAAIYNRGGQLVSPADDPGIIINIEASVLVPDGADALAAIGWLSVSANTWNCTALSEEKTIAVGLSVPAGAVPGDYVFSIVGTPPTGLGWGVGGHSLTVSVAEAPVLDTFVLDVTAPTVNITKPTAAAAFTFCLGGTPVDVAFDATESESPITALTATIGATPLTLTTAGLGTTAASATATPSIGLVGSYTLTATADNTRALPPGNPDNLSAHLTGSATVDFTVNYDMSNCWLPPLSLGKVSKGGSTIPIKFTARDCNGLFVNDPSVQVKVNEIVYDAVLGNQDVLKTSASFGTGSTAVRIDQTDAFTGQYIANFQTAAGAHKYRVDVFFNSFKQASKEFSVSAK